MRGNPQLLHDLREQLFNLWGDLEEQAAATLPPETKQYFPSSTAETTSSSSSPVRRAGDQPDADDSDNENRSSNTRSTIASKASILKERDLNIQSVDQVAEKPLGDGKPPTVTPKNKPFTCCIKQYGVKVYEDDPAKANAGEKRRWQRMFGIFGTTIS